MSDRSIRHVARTWRDVRAPDDRLEEDLRATLEEGETALASAVTSDLPLVSDAAGYLLAAGGKRFRPMLVLLGGRFGDPRHSGLIPAAVSIELTHLATLYHDDVIDEADARHGVPSTNVRWDNTVAILTGDYLFARASEISTDLGTDICALLARTIATLCDGQIREVEAAGRMDQTRGAYLEIIRRKTGALIATSSRTMSITVSTDASSQRSRARGRGSTRLWRTKSPSLGSFPMSPRIVIARRRAAPR